MQIFTAFIILAAPALALAGIDPIFALFGGIGLVLVPIELGYLTLQARRMTGSWSPLNAVDYKERVPRGRLALLAAGLAGWFFVVLVVSIVFLDRWLAENVFSSMPTTLLQFAVAEEGGEPIPSGTFLAFLVIALAFNGAADRSLRSCISVATCSRGWSVTVAGHPSSTPRCSRSTTSSRRGGIPRSSSGSSPLHGWRGASAASLCPSLRT